MIGCSNRAEKNRRDWHSKTWFIRQPTPRRESRERWLFENTWVYSTSCACAFVPVHGFWTAKPAVDSPIPESARHGWPPASVYTYYATRPSTKLNLNHRARQTVDHWRASADAKNEKKQALAQQSQPGQAASAPFDGERANGIRRGAQHRPRPRERSTAPSRGASLRTGRAEMPCWLVAAESVRAWGHGWGRRHGVAPADATPASWVPSRCTAMRLARCGASPITVPYAVKARAGTLIRLAPPRYRGGQRSCPPALIVQPSRTGRPRRASKRSIAPRLATQAQRGWWP